MKKKQITATQGYFTDYRDMKFKLTAHRLDSENRNTVLWKKNALYLSVHIFSTKALIGDTIFYVSPTGEGSAILRGHTSHAKV